MDVVSESLNKWVYKQLQVKGWSMRELGRRGDLNSSYISAVLSGKQEPGPKFYQGIAKAFEVTLESVEQLDRQGEIPQSRLDHPTFRQLMEVAQKLNLEDLQEVLDYAIHRLRKSKNLPL